MIHPSILKELSLLQNQIAEATKRADEIKRGLKAELDYGEHKIGDFKVTYAQRTRIDLDRELVAQALGEKVKDCEKISAYDVITLKRI